VFFLIICIYLFTFFKKRNFSFFEQKIIYFFKETFFLFSLEMQYRVVKLGIWQSIRVSVSIFSGVSIGRRINWLGLSFCSDKMGPSFLKELSQCRQTRKIVAFTTSYFVPHYLVHCLPPRPPDIRYVGRLQMKEVHYTKAVDRVFTAFCSENTRETSKLWRESSNTALRDLMFYAIHCVIVNLNP